MNDPVVPRELVDLERLVPWLDEQGLQVGESVSVTTLTSGRSNSMFSVRRGDVEWVLRRPALVAIERANEGMVREYRILEALAGSEVPHPSPVALCTDDGVLGCTFFLMEKVEGINPVTPLPASFGEEDRPAVAFAMVDALAALHRFDWRSNGLMDLGRPEGFHERQVDRWTTQLSSYGGRELPGIEEITRYLSANIPLHFEPALMHGDFHMFNALIAPSPPGVVTAVLDWETATIGDPLLDLIGFCEIWGKATSDSGWPGRIELLDRYRSRMPIEIPEDLSYYEALYNFRMAVLLEGIFQRSLRDTTRPALDDVGAGAMGFLDRARAVVAGSGDSGSIEGS